MVELHRRAKFGQNRSNGGLDMAIFQDGGGRHLGFLKNLKFLTVGRLYMVELRCRDKFG